MTRKAESVKDKACDCKKVTGSKYQDRAEVVLETKIIPKGGSQEYCLKIKESDLLFFFKRTNFYLVLCPLIYINKDCAIILNFISGDRKP